MGNHAINRAKPLGFIAHADISFNCVKVHFSHAELPFHTVRFTLVMSNYA